MDIQTGSLVKLDQFKVEGKVLEISENTVLIEHGIIQDGVSKIITQWYSKELVTGVIETEKVEAKVEVPVKSKKKKNKKGKKAIPVEFGIIPDPNKSI